MASKQMSATWSQRQCPVSWRGSAIGGMAAVLLHAAFLSPLIFGISVRKTAKPDAMGAGSSALVSSAVPVTTMIFFEENIQLTTDFQKWEELASRGFEISDSRIKVLSPDIRPPASLRRALDATDDTSAADEATGDSVGRALLFGRYMGQIEARIERAWTKPHSKISLESRSTEESVDDSFNCQVNILQKRDGSIIEVTLKECNGDGIWQQSLVDAIQRASPLPAPSDPSVFTNTISLSFSATSSKGENDDQGYKSGAQITWEGMPEKASATKTRVDGVLRLTIFGKRSVVPSSRVANPLDSDGASSDNYLIGMSNSEPPSESVSAASSAPSNPPGL